MLPPQQALISFIFLSDLLQRQKHFPGTLIAFLGSVFNSLFNYLCKSSAGFSCKPAEIQLAVIISDLFSHQDVIKGCSHAINICPLIQPDIIWHSCPGLIRLMKNILFRRCVSLRIPQRDILVQKERHIKIDQTNIPFRRQHDIIRFNISVNNRRFLAVKVIQSTTYLHTPPDQLVLCKRIPLSHKLLKRFPRDKSHGNVYPILQLQEIQNLGKIRMTQFL